MSSTLRMRVSSDWTLDSLTRRGYMDRVVEGVG